MSTELQGVCIRCRIEAPYAPSRKDWYALCAACVRDLAGLVALDEGGPAYRGPRFHLHDDVDAWLYDVIAENR